MWEYFGWVGFSRVVKPMLAVKANDEAEKSPWRGREARVPCSRPYCRRKPSRVLFRIWQGSARPKRVKVIRVTPQGVIRTSPDRVDSESPRSQPEGRGSHGPCCGPLTSQYLVHWDLSFMALRGILPCVRVPRSATDTSYPVRDIAPPPSSPQVLLN